MSENWVTYLHTIEKKNVYFNILRENLKASAEKLGLEDSSILKQENVPKHTAGIIPEFMLHNVPNNYRHLHNPYTLMQLGLWEKQIRRRNRNIKKKLFNMHIKKRMGRTHSFHTEKLVHLMNSMNKRLQA